MSKSIGQALAEWVDEQEHKEFIAATQACCSRRLGQPIQPGLRENLQREVDELHASFSRQAGRQLRRILVWIDADKNTLHLSLEPYVEISLVTVRL